MKNETKIKICAVFIMIVFIIPLSITWWLYALLVFMTKILDKLLGCVHFAHDYLITKAKKISDYLTSKVQ